MTSHISSRTLFVCPTGATLLLAADVPLLKLEGSQCATALSARFVSWCPAACAPAYAASRAALELSARRLSAFAASTPGVAFLNAHDFLCDGDGCGPFIPGSAVLAYNDLNHLTAEGSFSLWPYLRCRVFADEQLQYASPGRRTLGRVHARSLKEGPTNQTSARPSSQKGHHHARLGKGHTSRGEWRGVLG